jgi:DNA mismatch endonuclease (patch repair protein)
MNDIFSKEKRSKIMSSVNSKGSDIETSFRKALWHQGFRYRKNANDYFGTPDIVLPKHKTVIFIDSCFWHGCPEHFELPDTRKQFWKDKIQRNKKRDAEVTNHYKEKAEWKVFRVWEHDLKDDFEEKLRETIEGMKSN